MSFSIIDAINFWATQAALTALIPAANVWLDQAAEGAVLPRAVFSVVEDRPAYVFGLSRINYVTYKITVYATTLDGSATSLTAIVDALRTAYDFADLDAATMHNKWVGTLQKGLVQGAYVAEVKYQFAQALAPKVDS